jgi:glycosyltransferase involved in cell wall biosynthesis
MLHFFWTPYRWRVGAVDRYESANAEIVKHARRFFESVTPTHITHFNSGRVTDRPEDILLGHPTWDAAWQPGGAHSLLVDDWVKDNALTPGADSHPNTYLLMPWVPLMSPEFHTPFIDSQLKAARRIFAFCGDIWIQRTRELGDDNRHGAVKDKLVQVNLGCESRLFPSKTEFGTNNRRNFLHISNLAEYKNIGLLFQSLDGLDATLMIASQSLKKTGWITANCIDAYGRAKDCRFYSLGRISNDDPAINAFIIENFDFYIHTSTFDAQATVILENCARGLVPLITPESGFECPDAIYLTQNPKQNREIINQAMNMSEDEYVARSRGVRAHVRDHHDWDRIYRRIWSVIEDDQKHDAPTDDQGAVPSMPWSLDMWHTSNTAGVCGNAFPVNCAHAHFVSTPN